jgi:hypothetical protein
MAEQPFHSVFLHVAAYYPELVFDCVASGTRLKPVVYLTSNGHILARSHLAQWLACLRYRQAVAGSRPTDDD